MWERLPLFNRYSLAVKQSIYWPFWVSLLVLALDLSIVLAIWASLGNQAAIIAILFCAGLSIFFFKFTSLQIRFENDELFVGTARIERKYLGKISVLDKKEMIYLRGPGINPNAFMALRFWVKGGVKVEISDPRDPTPYWLFSCKKPAQLAQLLKN
jgi:hypothetical protein